MSTGVRRRSGASRNQNHKLELQGDELKAFSEEELQRRPEVTIINNYAVVVAYIRIGLKGIGALALLWATVVLLGGFISELMGEDFRTITIIAFLQAAGLAGGVLDDRVSFLWVWLVTLYRSTKSLGKKHRRRGTHYIRDWLDRPIHKAMRLTVVIILFPLASFTLSGPSICIALSVDRLPIEDKYIGDGDASKNINIKLALKIFYYMSVAHGATSILFTMIELVANVLLVKIVSRRYGFRTELLDGYLRQTMKMRVNNPASTENWNLITYGAALLDSHLPEDYVFGGRVLTMLIDQDVTLPITWLLIRSPRQRIQKLIGTLAWRNPAEREMRWLAARIVEHLAGDLSLAQFPGALECISSLLDTPYCNNGDQEALHLPFVTEHSKPRYKTGSCFKLCPITTLGRYGKKSENGAGIELDLVLPCLRILENLAQNRDNCTLIYNTKDLLSKIVAPINSNGLVQDIKSNAAWTKVVDGSLKVVSRLMGSSGSTGLKMRRLIANNSNAVKNLEAVMCMDTERNSSVIYLQIQVIEVLTQLVLHHPASSATTRREKLIERALHIFATNYWMEGYLKEEENRMQHQTTGQWTDDYLKEENSRMQHQTTSQQNTLPRPSTGTRMDSYIRIVSVVCPPILSVGGKARVPRAAEARLTVTRGAQAQLMKEAQESASQLKEKAGEALAMLSSDSEVIKSFTACKDVHVHCLTKLLDSNIKTIECQISPTDIVQIEINIGCRVSAAVILKHLSNYNMEPTLRKVLAELLPVRHAQASSTPRYWECLFPICCRNDIENPSDSGQDESSASQSHHIQQCNENRLQAELLSLAEAILANSNFNFAKILICPPASDTLLEDFVVRLKKMVEDNMYATPASLAIQKLTCKMVIGFLQHDQNVKVIDNHNIVGTILEASKAMAGLESSMLFAGVDRDCHGVPLKPLSSVLARRAEELLTQKKQALGINIAPIVVPSP